MMNTAFLISDRTNPYWNVAVENWLVSQPDTDCVVMHLWKNRRTVVIGQNQNPYAECNVDMLAADGGYVMRRTTGGGAVYHDDGNINFSFVAPYPLYDQQRQFEVIAEALRPFGLETVISGRNDLLCSGRKFSGNAFSKGQHQRLHHGTILIKGNMDDLARYLKVKPSKLHKHGVQSVKSRVVNLSELADITSENIVPQLVAAFDKVYGNTAQRLDFGEIVENPKVRELYDKFSSKAWIYGKWRTFAATRTAQFEWGNVEISLVVDEHNSVITDCILATDALDVSIADAVRRLLVGSSSKEAPKLPSDIQNKDAVADILAMLY